MKKSVEGWKKKRVMKGREHEFLGNDGHGMGYRHLPIALYELKTRKIYKNPLDSLHACLQPTEVEESLQLSIENPKWMKIVGLHFPETTQS